jgi:hypothetical protein
MQVKWNNFYNDELVTHFLYEVIKHEKNTVVV